MREAAPVWPRQNNLARRQTSPPLVTQPRSGARMTQVLVSLNTLGLEMNRQVMPVRVLHLGPFKLSGNMGMLKVARPGFCLQTDIHARQLKSVGIGGLSTF